MSESVLNLSDDIKEDIRAVCMASGYDCLDIRFDLAHTIPPGVHMPASLYLELVFPDGSVGYIGDEIDLTMWHSDRKKVLMDINIMIHSGFYSIKNKGDK